MRRELRKRWSAGKLRARANSAIVVSSCLLGTLFFAACANEAQRIDPEPTLILDLVRDGEPEDQEILALDLGSPESRASLLSGWSADTTREGRTIVWAEGRESVLELTLPQPSPLVVRFVGRGYGRTRGASRIAILLNDSPVGEILLHRRWRAIPHYLRLPASATTAGTNRFRLVYSDRASGDDRHDERRRRIAWDRIDILKATRVEQGADGEIRLPAGDSLSSTVLVAGSSALHIDGMTLLGEASGLRVERQIDSQASEVLTVIADPNTQPVELSADPGLVTLRLVAEGPPGSSIVLRNPQLRGSGRRSRRPNLILYVVDTLRADHLGCYGYPHATSPRLDALAKDYLLFEDAVSPSSWTRPSVASIMTGLDPRVHRAVNRDDGIPQTATTLAEELGRLGYRTGAVITNGNVHGRFGFSQGFDDYMYLGEDAGTVNLHKTAHMVHERAEEWIRSLAHGKPFFLYMHTTDPHDPYTPLSDPEAWNEVSGLLAQSAESVGAEDIARLTSLYDLEIRQNDEAFGMILDLLVDLGQWDDTMVIFTSDHGEEFGDHGGFRHGRTLFDEQIRVPLVVKPASPPDPIRVAATTRLTDIFPTVLEVVGLEPGAEVDGQSWLPSISQGAPPRPAFSHLDLDGRSAESVVLEEWKLIRTREDGGWRTQLFDRRRDPGEEQDLAEQEREQLRRMATLLTNHTEAQKPMSSTKIKIDEALKKRLEAAGYLK